MIVPPTRPAAAEDFLLTQGLLQAHVLGRVPLDRLAKDYGYQPARLRERLFAHLETCLTALACEAATPEPEPAPAAPAAPTFVRLTRRRLRQDREGATWA